MRALSAASEDIGGSAPGSEESWEVAEELSSGPSSAEFACITPRAAESELPVVSVLSAASASYDPIVAALDFETEAGEEEFEPDKALDLFTEVDLTCKPQPNCGTIGGRDLRRRAKRQARGPARDARHDRPKSLKAVLDREHLEHGKRMEKAKLARKQRADTKYRVEERKFKRRYRDWCCFQGFGVSAARRPGWWALPKANVALSGMAVANRARLGAVLVGATAATKTISTAAAPPPKEPVPDAGAAKQPAASESRRSAARDFMDAYAAVAYWRTIGLLQESYGHRSPVRVGMMMKSAGAKLASLKKQILSKAALAATRAPSRRRCRSWVAWDDLIPDRKSRGGRSLRRRAWNKVFRQKLRSALRRAPSRQQTPALATKLGLKERRRAASQARDKSRSAQRDFKYSEAASACSAPSPPAASTASAEPSKKRIAKGPCSSKSGASRSPPSRAEARRRALETEDVPARSPTSSTLDAKTSKRDKPKTWAPRLATDIANDRSGEAASLVDVLPASGDLDKDISECDDPEAWAPRLATESHNDWPSEWDSPAGLIPAGGDVDAEPILSSGKLGDETGAIGDPEAGPALKLDDVTGLISVWEHLDEFRFTPVPDDDGKLLVPALKCSAGQPSVATQETFLRRFQARTGGVFTGVDWTNLCAIGGMMLACLVADDGDFRKGFAETDVDIYVVGLSGSAFVARIARFVEEVYAAANARGFDVVVLRTPCTITLSLHCPYSEPLPNVQIIMSPFSTTRHLLETTDIDCTGFGFNGERLLSTRWAREAVAHRRVMARPEKYDIRGEWSTESRLLKYAMRGFRVVDPGLRPDAEVPSHAAVSAIAKQASAALLDKAFGRGADGLSLDATAMKHERMVRDTGVNGAHLLLLAQQNPGLRELLLYDVPLLPAGMGKKELLATLRVCDASSLKEDGYARTLGRGKVLPKKLCKLKALYPSSSGRRLRDVVMGAIQVRDPDGSCETRSWYNGLADGALRAGTGGQHEGTDGPLL